MRTTLNIEDSALDAARQLAWQRQEPVGKVVSDLINEALSSKQALSQPRSRNGLPLFPVKRNAGQATMELVKELLEEES